MTDVLGVFLEISTMEIDLGKDPEKPSLYEFSFVLGDYDV